ncbi:SCO family protein [Pedobacter duraquae]|uniref:Protein SCO1/2 n=1 Tax=Pedobacter duraquae TaxID=425511 RepID=A0A4R6IRK6_9SPHI|nr:SCO family protein [Pedobacter duraquae]TDO24907.1 protein SCO1/2 [Pedobacter duraquae]
MVKSFHYILAALFFAAGCQSKSERLPIYGNREAVTKIVDGKSITDTVYQTIPSFQFVNQDSVLIDNHLFDGKIYVADFFFTSCPSICPVMHRNMLKVYHKFQGNKDVMLLSHSIDFKYDVPHILKKYATKLGVNDQQWQFVHGSKEVTYTLAQKNYLVSVSVDPKAPGGYVHQGYLILVDKQKRVRGAYDGTVAEQVDQLMKDMDTLLKEQ